ncbi:MAG: class I SAM-dependent methyltransferase [Proteobacteria bacterium]|nr:class I SAM-dependent methyltransferase [Pseudomonadota bacterium]
MGYYDDKLDSLRDLFATGDVRVEDERVVIDGRAYPVLDDVIVLLDPALWPDGVRTRLGDAAAAGDGSAPFAPDIQKTFGAEWTKYAEILPEYGEVVRRYFDIVPARLLDGARILDLGCGTGRWSWFLKERARELVMVDFSEAIFVARRNLRDATGTLFFLRDVTRLPFRDRAADLVVCLGVLHHLPVDALTATRGLARLAPAALVYLYYALDNRPVLFRAVFRVADAVRRGLSRIEHPGARTALTWVGAAGLYLPFVGLGWLLRPLGVSRHVPLYEGYRDRSFKLMRQDFYDRFFTRIEQRVSRAEVAALADRFESVTISDAVPYWHFLCETPHDGAA